MKFNVVCAYLTAAMIAATENTELTDNYIGNSIEANTAEEAIDTAMDYIAEKINESGDCRAETENDSVVVYDYDDEIVGKYLRFQAKEA